MKKKRVVKTKEELLKELKKSQDFQEKMLFVKTKFYPVLMEASKSVEDATFFLSSLTDQIMQKFLGFMKDKKFRDLSIKEILAPDDEKYEELKKLIDLFQDMSVFDAKTLIEGMKQEIQMFINEEMRSRALGSLKTHWIDE